MASVQRHSATGRHCPPDLEEVLVGVLRAFTDAIRLTLLTVRPETLLKPLALSVSDFAAEDRKQFQASETRKDQDSVLALIPQGCLPSIPGG